MRKTKFPTPQGLLREWKTRLSLQDWTIKLVYNCKHEEMTLVHELLHLKLSLVSDNVPDLQVRYMHQIIDDMARAFVDVKRHKR